MTQPASNDIVPVRQQLIELDVANATIDASIDNYESNSGVGYVTNASQYAGTTTTSSGSSASSTVTVSTTSTTSSSTSY